MEFYGSHFDTARGDNHGSSHELQITRHLHFFQVTIVQHIVRTHTQVLLKEGVQRIMSTCSAEDKGSLTHALLISKLRSSIIC